MFALIPHNLCLLKTFDKTHRTNARTQASTQAMSLTHSIFRWIIRFSCGLNARNLPHLHINAYTTRFELFEFQIDSSIKHYCGLFKPSHPLMRGRKYWFLSFDADNTKLSTYNLCIRILFYWQTIYSIDWKMRVFNYDLTVFSGDSFASSVLWGRFVVGQTFPLLFETSNSWKLDETHQAKQYAT